MWRPSTVRVMTRCAAQYTSTVSTTALGTRPRSARPPSQTNEAGTWNMDWPAANLNANPRAISITLRVTINEGTLRYVTNVPEKSPTPPQMTTAATQHPTMPAAEAFSAPATPRISKV